jgi:hypothetical protein
MAVRALVAAFCVSSAGAAPIDCQACTFATSELMKANPVLGKPEKREGDKALALGDALPSMCLSNVFKGLADAAALEAACKPFAAAEGPVAKALLEGGDACAAVCEGVPEDARAPAAAAQKPGKAAAPKKGGARKGTVDDPAYKQALKAKAKRDAERAKRNGKKGGEEAAEL